MESSLGKISSSAVLGLGVARKTKSLDLQSIYKSKVSKEGLPKRESYPVQNGGEASDDSKKKKKKRKKSGKEVALVGLEPVAKKSRKNLDEGQVDDAQSGLVSVDSASSLSGLSHKNGLNGLALSLGGSGNVIRIPRRPRGFVGRRKGEGNGSVKPSGPSCQGGQLNGELRKIDSSGLSGGEPGSDDKISKLPSGSRGNVGGSKAKRKRNVREVKVSGNVGEGKESSTVAEVKDSRNVGEVKKSKNIGEVKKSRTVGEGKKSRTVGEVKKSKNIGEVKKSRTVGEVKESKTVAEVEESKTVAEVEESKTVVEVEESKMVAEVEESKTVAEVEESKTVAEVKESKSLSEGKETGNGKSGSSQNAKEEDGHHVVNNGNTSSRKRLRKQKKRMDLASGNETSRKKVEHSLENSSIAFDDFQDDDDDEEKLEQNAARMLSSRFDPRCTGFTSGRLSDNAISFSRSSRRDFVSRGAESIRSSKSKDANRVLRPRKQLKDKGLSRKRRHFYEIVTTDLDAFWFLNRRIKVFWPLDESWYYGLVNDYNPEIKLHHVKYDDRDEEWIDLHNEKFKLLLLPSEVPGRGGERKSPMPENYWDKRKTDSEDDNSYEGSYLDSEPIISWLSRSSRRVKSPPSSNLKEEKTLQLSRSLVPTVLSSRTDDKNGDVGSLAGGGGKYDYDSTLPDKSVDGERAKNSLLGSPSSSKGSKPVVYVRRRLNKRREGLSPLCENNKASIGPRQNCISSAAVVDNLHLWKEYDSSLVCSEFDKLLWSLDDQGLLRLRVHLGESKGFRFNVCLPILPFLDCSVLADHLGLSLSLLLSHYGTIMTTWPEVALEMLFVDNIIGLKFLLYEGCLKLAVELFSLILTVFSQSPREWKFIDMELPVTSIRFKLSSKQDLTRHREFAFYSFSKLKQSKWLYLDSKLQQHCLLSKQLPLSECTYDNIKTFEHGSCRSDAPHVDPGCSPFKTRFIRSVLPLGVSRESSNKMITPSSVNSAIKSGQIPTFALSFTAAPAFFLSLHLKLLMERNFACISLRDDSSQCSFEDSVVAIQPAAVCFPQVESCQENVLGTATEIDKRITLLRATTELLCYTDSCSVRDVNSEEGDGDRTKSAEDPDHGNSGTIVDSSSSKDSEMAAADRVVHPKKCESQNQESEQTLASPVASVPESSSSLGDRVVHPKKCESQNQESEQTVASPVASVPESYSSLGSLSIELPSSDHIDKPVDGGLNISGQVSDLAGSISDDVVQSAYQTCLKSSWRSDRNDSSSPFGDLSPIWPDGKSVFIGSGPKKPRTRVRYTLPAGGYDSHSKYKSQNQRPFSYKRIRRSNEKRISDGLINSQKDLELMSCDANVLVTLRDKGWRECGARIVLELTDQNECRLAVKVSGVTKYSHKVDHILQPGSTNRYTHAMMWKGGKDWVLEFPDRNQWVIFKEMHEECHNRNIRAASVKNIPIPGVRLIEESDDHATDIIFIHNSSMYFRQVESDVEMAMDPSRVLYDMDSDDEDWILKNGKLLSTGEHNFKEISCELFEKVMDMLEKFAYAQQRDQFTVDELEELMVGIDSMEIVKGIYEHWRQKRQREGMPLIRHFQPPLWERYQQQVKEWEQAVARATATSSVGCKEKTPLIEKPPMFAFCLKPRGLEVPNKGSKQRSHRRFPVSGNSQLASGDQDGFHTSVSGRRLNGFAAGDERTVFSGNNHDFSDSSPSLQASARVFSPRDAGGQGFFSLNSDVPEWNHYPRYHWNKPRKNGAFPSPSSAKLVPYPQRTVGMRNGVHRWSMDLPEWPSQKHHIFEGSLRHGIEPLNDSDLHEFRLRDASGAAQHALNMAKLKRENAKRLLYKADLAIHKAVVALMTAEAKKEAFDSSAGDG